ncbi:hypothetical protein L6164_011406 [Bauhinia variegata]|uniref:Uncharacterized protein n=1 Tax=Bauhinia variegata TaxID=167791 RepID=A0ACB9P5W7_BAUVA|nr:hypothetical protein L6164_011406 [Bauhinia variegata]
MAVTGRLSASSWTQMAENRGTNGCPELTNEYLTSVLMNLAPKSVPISESELSAIGMTVFLGFDLVGGSFLGWFWII